MTLDEGDLELPDILTDLQDKTQLTRRSIHMRRLLGPIGDVPPAEFEAQYYEQAKVA